MLPDSSCGKHQLTGRLYGASRTLLWGVARRCDQRLTVLIEELTQYQEHHERVRPTGRNEEHRKEPDQQQGRLGLTGRPRPIRGFQVPRVDQRISGFGGEQAIRAEVHQVLMHRER
ncbi:MAG: hypothetical protein WBA97_26075 [Actinophytocola sp.]